MADTAALVVALSAQLSKFEKDLAKAGVIAEKSVQDIESKFSKLNPQISASFFGNLFANFADKAVSAAITAVEGLIARFKDLQRTAEYAAVSMQWLYGLQEAGSKAGASVGAINAAVKALAFSLDEMKRGGDNALKTLLDANPQFLKGVSRDALTVQQTLKIVADIISQAKTEVQAFDMAKHLGLPEETVKLLEKGGDAVARLSNQASQTAPDFERMAAAAKEFDEHVENAVKWLKALPVRLFEAFQNLGDTAEEKTFPRGEPSAAITVNAKPKTPGSAVDPFATKTAAGDASAWQRTNDQINKNILLMEASTEAVGKNAGEQERLRVIALLKAAADKDGTKITAEMTKQMEAQSTAAANAALTLAVYQSKMKDLNDASKEFGSALADGFKGLVLEGKKLDEVLKNLMNRLASKAIDQLFNLAFASPAGGGNSMFASLFAGMIPARAGGGSVNAGTPYLVGEHGPELMVPGQSGMVVPNQALGRSGRSLTVAPIYNIDASGADTAAVARLQAALIATNRSLESRALAAVSSHMARGA